MPPRRRPLPPILALLLFAWCSLARAEQAAPAPPSAPAEAACVFERYISVVAESGFDAALADEVRKDLAAELAPRGFGVCPGRATQGELVAEVVLAQREPALVTIEVEDHTTGKRVARDVRLARIPAGGVALAIAIATDELLRASWAELMLRRSADEPQGEAGSETAASDATATEPVGSDATAQARPPVLWQLALAFDYMHARHDWDGLGLDLRLRVRAFRYGFFELGAGGVSAVPVDGELGTARAAGLLALLSAGVCGQANARIALCGGARGTFQWTRFRGSDGEDAQGLRADLSSLVLAGLAQIELKVSARWFLMGELSLGAAPVAARVTDGEDTVMAIEGPIVGAALGAGVSL